MNARFWIYHNGGFVKLTMKEGDEINLHEGGSHEEGYSHTWESFEYYDGIVRRSVSTESRDCDGKTSYNRDTEASIAQLRARKPYRENDPDYCPEPGAMFPEWKETSACNRDYSAEAMGY